MPFIFWLTEVPSFGWESSDLLALKTISGYCCVQVKQFLCIEIIFFFEGDECGGGDPLV